MKQPAHGLPFLSLLPHKENHQTAAYPYLPLQAAMRFPASVSKCWQCRHPLPDSMRPHRDKLTQPPVSISMMRTTTAVPPHTTAIPPAVSSASTQTTVQHQLLLAAQPREMPLTWQLSVQAPHSVRVLPWQTLLLVCLPFPKPKHAKHKPTVPCSTAKTGMPMKKTTVQKT